MSKREIRKQDQARRRRTLNLVAVVTIAQYGPDDKAITKVVAGYVPRPGAEPKALRRWVGTGIPESPDFRRELLEFVHSHRAGRIVFTAGVIGCVHEEGKDYPAGAACPFCPFWAGRDRLAKARPFVFERRRLEPDTPWPTVAPE